MDGNAYTRQITRYDRLYQVEPAAVIIPDSEGALAGTYAEATSRHVNGLVQARSFSTVGNIVGKGWNYTYEDDTLRPIATYTSGVRADVNYSLTGKPLWYELGGTEAGMKKTRVTNTYEWGTQRLATSRVDRQDITGVDRHNTYTYDAVGNVLSISDASRTGTDTQCFTYDYLRRLTEAWTQDVETCAASPAQAAIAGPAPYWHSYTYDKAGNRLTQTEHDPGGDAAQDVEHTYAYPAPGSPQAHTLTSVTRAGPAGTARDTYGYDEAGNTITRTLSGDTEKLTWGPEGHLTRIAQPVEGGDDQVTEYVYDASGNRLITRSPTETTLHLGHTEVTVAKGSDTVKATRYIPLGGGHQAILTDDGTWSLTLADHHGTGQLAIDAATLELTQRRVLPFGGFRGDQPAEWPGSRGFVGGIDETDTTGLVHLGAREYDPTLGRFISVDPLMTLTDPQQMHGYTYAKNNPLTYSDPSGMAVPSGDYIRPDEDFVDAGGTYHDNDGVRNRKYCDTHRCIVNVPEKPTSFTRPTRNDKPWLDPHTGESLPLRENTEYLEVYLERFQFWMDGRDWNDPQALALAQNAAMLDACTSTLEHSECLPELRRHHAGHRSAGTYLGWDGGSVGVSGSVGGRGRPHCNSFVGGTEVLLADGTSKPIEDLKIGDKVLAADPKTGELRTETVTAEIIGTGEKRLVKLSLDIDGESGQETSVVTATDGHPFWVPELGEWVDAEDLRVGQWLKTSAGTRVQVTAITRWTQQATVHNLTVTDLHTYYVLAGETPVLVHNANCWSATKKKSSVENAFGHWQKHKSEFPNLNNAKEYVEAATKFLRSADPNVLTRTRSNGDVIRFNPATDEFGVMDPSGVPRTYFKPDPASHGYPTNMDYFNAQ